MTTRSPRRVWVLRGASALVALVGLVAWAAWSFWLPGWVEGRVREALRARGVEPVSLEVHAPGLGGVRIREVRLGAEPALRIGEIALGWSWGSLRGARADELVLRDVEWRLALRGGRFDFGALAPLLAPQPAAAAPPAPLAVPLSRIRLEGLRIRLATEAGEVEAHAVAEARLGVAGVESARLTVEASDAARSLELRARAVLGAEGRLEVDAEGRVAGAAARLLPVADLEAGGFALGLTGFAPVLGHAFEPAPRPQDGLALDASGSVEGRAGGATGEADLALHVDGVRAQLQLDARNLRAAGLEAPHAGLSLHVTDWTQPIPVLDTVLLGVRDARFAEVAIPFAQLDLQPDPEAPLGRARLSLRGEVSASGLPATRLDLAGAVESREDELRLDAPGCARVSVAAGDLGGGGWRLAEPLALCVERTSVAWRREGAGDARLAGAAVIPPSALALRHRDGRRIAGATPRLTAAGSRDATGDALRIESAGGELRVEHLALALRGLDAALDLTRASEVGLAAKLDLTLEELRDTAATPRLPPLALAAEASLERDHVRFAAQARDPSGALRLAARGLHALASGGGHAALDLAPLRFERKGVQPAALVPLLAPWVSRARGGLAADAQLAWNAAGLAPVHATLLVDRLGADTPWGRLRGLEAALRFDDALGLSTAGSQHVMAQRLDPGLPLEGASLTFTLAGGRIDVPSFEAALADGRVEATGRFDPAAGNGALALNLRALDLVALLEGGRVDGLAATGRLGGRIEAALEAGTPRGITGRLDAEPGGGVIQYRPAVPPASLAATGRLGGRIDAALESGTPRDLDGRLDAEPGGGVIQYRPAVPPASLAAAGAGGALALEALRDFHYDRLSLRIGGDFEHAEVRVELGGANPAVQNGQRIEFQLNFTSAFGELLRAWRLQQQLEERLAHPPEATRPR